MAENKKKEVKLATLATILLCFLNLHVATSKNTPWQTPNSIDRLEFDLSTGDYNNDLIQKMRTTFQEPGRYSHNLPILPARRGVAAMKWTDVVLKTDSNTVTVRIRHENLYLDGYQMKNGQWLEFDNDLDDGTTHLIPGSTFLGFNGSYLELQRVSGRPLTGTEVSSESVRHAVSNLAKTTKSKERAEDLTLLIVFICEATRFNKISSIFANAMKSGTKVTIEDWMDKLFHAWGDISGRLLRADADGDSYFRLPSDSPLRQRISNALDAADYLGILLGPKTQTTNTILMVGFGADKDVPEGQPMMELLSFQIQGFSGVLSGTIDVTDGLGPQNLFNGRQSVRSGDSTLPLKTLERAISAWQSAVIQYNLVVEGTELKCSNTVSWDIFQITNSYAITKSDSFACSSNTGSSTSSTVGEGLNGLALDNTATSAIVTINRVIFPVAWQLSWLVTIVKGDGNNNPIKVYGSIVASCGYDGKTYTVELFSRTADNYAAVSVAGNVPLLKSMTAVPYDEDLTVNIDLWDCKGPVLIAQGNSTWHVGGQGPTGQFVTTINDRVKITGKWSRLSQTDDLLLLSPGLDDI